MKQSIKRMTVLSMAAVTACAVEAANPNDPAKLIYSVGPGESKTLNTSVRATVEGEWYDIQGCLEIVSGGNLFGKTSTNWLHGVSADKPAQVVCTKDAKLFSEWDAVFACDGYLAQPAMDITTGWDQYTIYSIDIQPTAKPVDANGNLLATNEILRLRTPGYIGFLGGYRVMNYSTIPAVITVDGADDRQYADSTGFRLTNNNNHRSAIEGGEIILRSTVTASGKTYPVVYFVNGSTCGALTIPFPHASDKGRLTIDGGAGLVTRALNKSNFGTASMTASYDSGKIAWLTTGPCVFENTILRPEVDDSLPYADDHVVTIGVTRRTDYDWSSVTDWSNYNACLDVNGKTAKVGKLYTENGAVVTNLAETTGTLVFGANGLESGFSGVAAAGVVLRKVGSAPMRLGDGSQIDTLEFDAEATGKLMAEAGQQATIRVKVLKIGDVMKPTGVYSAANVPQAIGGGLIILVGDAEPTYWVGGAENDWNTAANWSTGVVPGSGDYVIFTNVVSRLYVQGDADIDISPDGIVLDCRAGNATTDGVMLNLSFAGSGCLCKAGPKMLKYGQVQKHTGGTRVLGGLVYANAADVGAYGWGAGPITIDREGKMDPYLYIYNPQHMMTNEVRILGSFTGKSKYSLYFGNDGGELRGKITADDDFTIMSGYCYEKYSRVYGDIDARGKTMFVTEPGYGSAICLKGEINCSVDTYSVSGKTVADGYSRRIDFYFDGTNTNVDANLYLRDFTNVFSQAAVWAGTNVVVRLATTDGQPVVDQDGRLHTTTLALCGNDNLSKDATLRLDEHCSLDIAKGVKVSVKACFVNGVELAPGTYSKSRLPGVIYGNGRLKVGDGVNGLTIVVR